jgi:hypothetical protein
MVLTAVAVHHLAKTVKKSKDEEDDRKVIRILGSAISLTVILAIYVAVRRNWNCKESSKRWGPIVFALLDPLTYLNNSLLLWFVCPKHA